MGKWIVTVGVQDAAGVWREQRYQVEAADLRQAREAGHERARDANAYAQQIREYGAEPLIAGRSRRRRRGPPQLLSRLGSRPPGSA